MHNISHLDQITQDLLNTLTEEIKSAFGSGLISFYLYGSAAGMDYIPGKSNLNTLVILNNASGAELKSIVRLYNKHRKTRLVAPLVLTPEYIRSSTDVFPIEFLDMKDNSVLLAGHDFIKDIEIDTSHLRSECEREIKGQITRLRSLFIETAGDKTELARLVIASVSSIIFTLKNVLRLLKLNSDQTGEEIVMACCNALGISNVYFLEALTIKKEGSSPGAERLEELYFNYLASVEQLAKKVDTLKSEGRL